MSWPLLRPWVLAAATGSLLPLCFPDFDQAWLAWIALIPLHLALPGLSPRRALSVGWAGGTLAFVGIVWWVITAMHVYGKVPMVPSFLVMLLLAGYLGLFVGVYAAGVSLLRESHRAWLTLTAPSLWVSLELIRTYLLSGFPWELLGYSQYRWLGVIQIADVTAVYGVSFLVVMVNVALAELLLSSLPTAESTRLPLAWPPALAAGLILALSLFYGSVRLSDYRRQPDAPGLAIRLIQANIDQAHKWDAAYRRETLDRYARLTQGNGNEADFIIWPEAATPFLFEQETPYRAEVTALIQGQGVPLLFGSPALRRYEDGRPYLLNSAYLLTAEGQIAGRYDKQHLVPFGEYIPLKSSLLFFLDKLVEGIGDFEAGQEPTVLAVPPRIVLAAPQAAPPAHGPRFGVVICYEVIFPDLVRRFADHGADFMVTMTNDAWFGRSAAASQHFSMVVFRAVENRTAFARAANTGVSGFIDRDGRILEASPIFEERALTGRLPIGHSSTVYSNYGDVFAYGCAIIAAVFILAAWQRGRQEVRGERR